jgi:hypothetical protein
MVILALLNISVLRISSNPLARICSTVAGLANASKR